jgi:cytochrome c oxidase subunit IV
MHLSYEESIKHVYKGLVILGVVTLIEVFFSLIGKGDFFPALANAAPKVTLIVTGLIIIVLSLYKAYYIIGDFMHMKYEVRGLALTVLLPTALLIWAIIAFLQEGGSWGARREWVRQKNIAPAEQPAKPGPQGMMMPGEEDAYYRMF